MIYQVDRIVRDVRVCIDENRATEALEGFGDVDTLSLDDIIKSKVVEAVTTVHNTAPYWLLTPGHNFEDDEVGIVWKDNDTCGYVMLPEDFMRLLVFEMSDWERPVYTTITPLDPLYKRQSSRVKALRGTAQRPVCVIGMRPTGKVLEFYSCKSDEALVTQAVYLPYPRIEEDVNTHAELIEICEQVYDAVVYTVAALTLTSCGEPERAKQFSEIANTFMQ